MAFDREAAKADGYTDEQIDAYLATKGQPLPPDTPRDRGEEQIAVAQGMGMSAADTALDIAKYGLGGAAAYGLGKKIFGPIKPPPPPPVTFTGGANPAFDAALSKPYKPPGMIERGMDYANQMRKVAADKVMQGVRAAAPIAENVAGAARAVAPAAIGLTAALMPGNAGQQYNFPQKGPFAGMEINPNTGRPWTQQELAQYR